MSKRNGGFTIIELIGAIAFIGIVVVCVFGVMVACCGNFWYSEDSVLRELKVDHPKVTEVLKTNQNIIAKSIITVKENGVNHDYCLDTNVLWNYEFSECIK